jgi:AraC-like DNA-binding protein
MLSAALKGDDVAGQTDLSPLSVALRQRVLEFIEQNLHWRELSPGSIQRRFNVSRSHLYRAFENDGGVAKVLRERRLDAAFAELIRSGNTTRSIARIAYDLGFSSSQQFLRSFRARFGAKPSEVRGDGFANWQSNISLQSHFIDLSNRIPETHL